MKSKWFLICFLSSFIWRMTTEEKIVIEIHQEVGVREQDCQKEEEEAEQRKRCTVGEEVYGPGEEWRDKCDIYMCDNGTPKLNRMHESCCTVGEEVYGHGEEWRDQCDVYMCDDGTPKLNRTHESCCTVGEEVYEHGEEWSDQCEINICDNGTSTLNRTLESCCDTKAGLIMDGEEVEYGCHAWRCANLKAHLVGYLDAVPDNMDIVAGDYYLPVTTTGDQFEASDQCKKLGLILGQPPSDIFLFTLYLHTQNAGPKWWIGATLDKDDNKFYYDRDDTQVPDSLWASSPILDEDYFPLLDTGSGKLTAIYYDADYPYVCQCLAQNSDIDY